MSGARCAQRRGVGATTQREDSSPRRPSLLCIAYAFAPVNRSGTHRTLGFIRHLDRWGWDATVLTVEPQGEPVDAELEKRVPASTTVVRTHWAPLTRRVRELCGFARAGAGRRRENSADSDSSKANAPMASASVVEKSLRDWFSRLLLTPDSRLGWVFPAVRAARRAIRHRDHQVIYSTSPFASAHLIALAVSRWTGLPWVADFRDPWRGNPFRTLGYQSLERWDAWLERQVYRHATRIVCNTPTQQARLVERLPWTTQKTVTVPNGFDAEWIAQARPHRTVGRDHFVMVHCGNCYGPRSPLALFGALRRVADRSPRIAQRVRVLLVGDDGYNGHSLSALADRFGVRGMVEIVGVRPHAEAIGLLLGADASIVLGVAGPGGELQVPNKLYEYLAVRKPILALAPSTGAIAEVLGRASADHLICDPRDEEQIAVGIELMVKQRHGFVDAPWSGVAWYDRRRSAYALARMFDEISGAALAPPSPRPTWDAASEPPEAGRLHRPRMAMNVLAQA
ncbi:MAG: glycosyltransferase [Phycisphaerales bacterium]|nr:MAG: glycosyltransferase [Phycisphaerales bacterium]